MIKSTWLHAAQVMSEKKWRENYTKHVCHSAVLGAKSSKNALAIAKAGLDEMYDTFEFFCHDGQSGPLPGVS